MLMHIYLHLFVQHDLKTAGGGGSLLSLSVLNDYIALFFSNICMSMFLSHPMEFHVEATSITHWLSLCISSPQGGGGGVTVGAGQTHPPRGRLQR